MSQYVRYSNEVKWRCFLKSKISEIVTELQLMKSRCENLWTTLISLLTYFYNSHIFHTTKRGSVFEFTCVFNVQNKLYFTFNGNLFFCNFSFTIFHILFVLLFSFSSHSLLDYPQSSSVMEAAYSCHWYDGSEEAKTFVQIVCQQCQKAMSISGAKFFTVSLDLFASVWHIFIFSFLCVLCLLLSWLLSFCCKVPSYALQVMFICCCCLLHWICGFAIAYGNSTPWRLCYLPLACLSPCKVAICHFRTKFILLLFWFLFSHVFYAHISNIFTYWITKISNFLSLSLSHQKGSWRCCHLLHGAGAIEVDKTNNNNVKKEIAAPI